MNGIIGNLIGDYFARNATKHAHLAGEVWTWSVRLAAGVVVFKVGCIAVRVINKELRRGDPSAVSRIYSRLLEFCSHKHATLLRDNFRMINAPDVVTVAGHAHGTAAARRSAWIDVCRKLVSKAGYSEHYISEAGRDTKRGVKGQKAFYMAKDVAATYRYDDMVGHCVIRMDDVDYYVDMKEMMAKGKPILMYHFNPRDAAGTVDDGTYYIKDNRVTLNVTGGGCYEHEVWDYSSDTISTDYWWGTQVFACDVRVDPQDISRQVTLLQPIRTIYGPLGWFLPGTRLARRQLSFGDWNKLEYVTSQGGETHKYISFSMSGSTVCATIPEEALLVSHLKAKRSKESIMGSLEGLIRTYAKDPRFSWWASRGNPTTRAALMTEVLELAPHLLGQKVGNQHLSFPSPVHYTMHHPEHLLETPKNGIRVLEVEPFMDNGTAPTLCMSNDKASILHRVTLMANTKVPPKKYDMYAIEFMRHLIPDDRAGTYIPVDIDTVYERQNRPPQRRILNSVVHFLGMCKVPIVKAFQKREPQSKFGTPRNISQMNADFKCRYSRYCYALAEAFYPQRWYAFSKDPKELEECITHMMQNANFVVPTDFSRFDGTHSKWFSEKELELLLRAFPEEYHAEIVELYSSQYNTIGFTRFGFMYATLWSRLSGSPETSLFNTFDNALCAYIALRESGLSAELAWEGLGIYGGDDGLTVGVQKNLYESVATKLGLTLKAETLKDEPLPFLGRTWYGPWNSPLTDALSFSDVGRQLSKLHMTTADSKVSPLVVLYQKAVGFLLTDSQTPILSQWARAVLRICEHNRINGEGFDEACRLDNRWFERYDRSRNFTPCNAEAYGLVAESLGVPVEHVWDICSRLDAVQGTDSIQATFFHAIPGQRDDPKEGPVVAGGDYIPAAVPNQPPNTPASLDDDFEVFGEQPQTVLPVHSSTTPDSRPKRVATTPHRVWNRRGGHRNRVGTTQPGDNARNVAVRPL